mmetsp:Transcript_42620/g.120579  ORF Transcript_42620/g.120579 Transcript_42620/m.120579 type:complete len:481 (-) Transcript_42620:196-1638(-)
MVWLQRRPRCPTLLLAGVVTHLLEVSGLYMQGDLPPTTNFAAFAGKFCFDANHEPVPVGHLDIELKWPKVMSSGPGKLYFLLFDDRKTHWAQPSEAWESWRHDACRDTSRLKDQASFVNVISDHIDDQKTQFSQVIYIQEHIRPRFWYAVFLACDIPAGTNFSYTLHATNDLWGWQKEFSYDHMGLIPFFVVCMAGFLLVTCVTFWAVRWRLVSMTDLQGGNPYVQLLVLLCLTSLASSFFFLVHYLRFVDNGHGSLWLRTFGIVSGAVSNCTMLIIVALSSIGWAISCKAVTFSRRCIFAAVFTVAVGSVYCEIRSQVALDVSTRLYAYESTVGVLILMMKVLIFSWALYQIRSTYKGEWEEKNLKFFRVLSVGVACWSLSAPIVALLAFVVSPWWRFGVVMVTEMLARLAGVTLLVGIFSSPLSPIHAQMSAATLDVNPDKMGLGMEVLCGQPPADGENGGARLPSRELPLLQGPLHV